MPRLVAADHGLFNLDLFGDALFDDVARAVAVGAVVLVAPHHLARVRALTIIVLLLVQPGLTFSSIPELVCRILAAEHVVDPTGDAGHRGVDGRSGLAAPDPPGHDAHLNVSAGIILPGTDQGSAPVAPA